MLLCVLLGIALAVRAVTNVPPPKPQPVTDPIAAAEPPSPVPILTSDGDLVLDLFNPSEASLNGQLNETALKARLEDAITVSFLLRRCEYLTQQTYNDTYRALTLYAQRTSPGISDAQLQILIANAIEAGSASYRLMYSRLSCDLPQLAAAHAQLAHWRASMLNPQQ